MNVNITDQQLQILILFFIRSAGTPVPEDTLADILGICNINCLNVQQCIAELSEAGHIARLEDDGKYYIKLSDTGIVIADTLKQQVPYTIRQHAAEVAISRLGELRRRLGCEAKVQASQRADDLPFCVTLSIKDQDSPLMSLCMYTPTEFQAQLIADNFKKSPTDVYKRVVNALTESRPPEED